jgi:hypothetical protein
MKYQFLKTILNIISKDLPKPLGRWKIEYCNKKMDYKIDLSNEDHCGPCGQYALEIKKHNTVVEKEKEK